MLRRKLLMSAAGLTAAPAPVIDTHIHLFDTTRPQGVPWPEKSNAALYKPAMPDRYYKLSAPFGIVGAIEVECSPWFDDNQWVLDVAAKDKIVVGTVGNLDPGKPEFRKQLEGLHRNPLFRGIRYGNIWNRDLSSAITNPAFVADLKFLAEAGLSLDTANQDNKLLTAALGVSERVPNLRVILDHLPQLAKPDETLLRELAAHKQVFVKLSAVLRKKDGKISENLADYKPGLDRLYELFGPDRVMYGSDWPNSDNWRPYDVVFRIVREYFDGKSREAAEKYFWKNSIAAYRWAPRDASQPH